MTDGRVLTIPNVISVVRLACIPLFCWLLFGTWGACRRSYRRAFKARDPALAAVCLGVLAATGAYILMSFDSNLMTQVAVAGTFWALAAVGHAAGWVELRPRPE